MRSPSRRPNGRHRTTVQPAAGVTTTLLLRRTRELERHLPSAIEGDDVGVHRARVASRRLREAVPVVAAGLKRGRKAQRMIRKVTRALGGVRELHVTTRLVDELARTTGAPRAAFEEVRGYVLAERDSRHEKMLQRLRSLDTRKLYRRLQQVADELEAGGGSDWKATLAERIRLRSKRLVAAIHTAGQVYAPDRLHAVRIAVKKLRYAVELAADAGAGGAAQIVAPLKRTQETLGRLNDLHVLQEQVALVLARPRADSGTSDAGLTAIVDRIEAECRHLHGRYVKQVPTLLTLADTCRTTLVAQLGQPVRQPLRILGAAPARQPHARRA